MQIEKRYVIDGPDAGGENYPRKGDATKAAAKLDDRHNAARRRQALEDRELPIHTVRGPVEFLVDPYAVRSNRDGELVIRDVDEQTAEAEAARLTAEQAERRASEPLNTGRLDDEHRRDIGADLNPTTYSTRRLPDRELHDQEA